MPSSSWLPQRASSPSLSSASPSRCPSPSPDATTSTSTSTRRLNRKAAPPFPYCLRYPAPDPTDPFAPLSVLRSRTSSHMSDSQARSKSLPDPPVSAPLKSGFEFPRPEDGSGTKGAGRAETGYTFGLAGGTARVARVVAPRAFGPRQTQRVFF
ncbi:hypothetical protein EW146_g4604 [Bondarzewia mesenterica]|uniref:Uncharacterized protein n=1 Tax=Bondarzewia mesenterica TaxID=1095465 RepID=A0A4S4LUK9_9AGAM|nr:hypothetical protein EW146_g4604 [Bondarzewia mesenterica]